MTEENTAPRGRKRSLGVVLAIAAAGLLVVSAGAFTAWSYTCPCDRTPGAYLMGAAPGGPVDDWSFANDITLCQIQVSVGIRPHSINLNCMATDTGQLYLSCSQCGTKSWSNAAVANGRARIRLDGTVYPVTLTRVMEPGELDRAWAARALKLETLPEPANPPPPPGTLRSDDWWTFRVESRAG